MTETLEARFQTQTVARTQEFSRIKEVVSGWSGVRQYLRGGDEGQIVPVVIPKDRRRYGWLFLLGVAVYLLGFALFSGSAALAGPGRAGRGLLPRRSRCSGCGGAPSSRSSRARPACARATGGSKARSRRAGTTSGGRGTGSSSSSTPRRRSLTSRLWPSARRGRTCR